MKPTLSLSLLAIASTLTACGTQTPISESSPAPETETMETTADLPVDSAQRIVALTSLSADIIYHLDSERLVGIPGSSLFKDRPELQEIAVVSQGRTPPQLETIVALEPDLVIGARGFHDQALAQLEATGIPVLATETNNWEDFEQLIQNLAVVTESEAAPLATQYGACLETPPGETPSVLVLVSRQPLLSPNANSWAGALLNRFAVQNLTAEMQTQGPIAGYVTLSAEKVLTENPDLLLLVDTGEGMVDQMKAEPFWNDLKAVQTDQVHVFDYYGLVNPGSLNSINQVCQQLVEVLAAPTAGAMPSTAHKQDTDFD